MKYLQATDSPVSHQGPIHMTSKVSMFNHDLVNTRWVISHIENVGESWGTL